MTYHYPLYFYYVHIIIILTMIDDKIFLRRPSWWGLTPVLAALELAVRRPASRTNRDQSGKINYYTTIVVDFFITRELILSSSFESFCLVINMFGNYNWKLVHKVFKILTWWTYVLDFLFCLDTSLFLLLSRERTRWEMKSKENYR